MDDAELHAEFELVAELQSLSIAIRDDVNAGAGPSTWQLRRAQIAELRERVRSMRDRHLARMAAASVSAPRAADVGSNDVRA